MIVSVARTAIMYFLLMTVVRLLGKRQLGQMEPSELVVTMLVADLASFPLVQSDATLFDGIIPVVTVLLLEYLSSQLALRSIRLRKLLCGKPVILMENGKILRKNLQATRITLDELTGLLREKDVLDLRSVQYAILETNCNLSVFLYPEEKPATAKDAGISAQKQLLPVTIVSDGRVLKENLRLSGKDENWLKQQLRTRKVALKDTWLLTVDGENNVVFYSD